MSIKSKLIHKWLPQILLVILLALVFWSIVVFYLLRLSMDATAWMTLFLAIITGGVVWWQGRQLQIQLELQTLIELSKEWNGKEMKKYRKDLCLLLSSGDQSIIDYSDDTLIKVERVLEFLEKIASFSRRHVLTVKLIWDTIGWDIMRYYFYMKEAISKIREKWGHDDSLYGDLEYLYDELMDIELADRRKKDYGITKAGDIENKFREEVGKFKAIECHE